MYQVQESQQAIQDDSQEPQNNSHESSENSPQEPPKRKRGRPRSFAEGSTIAISVSIEKRQKEWLDEVAASAPQESASKVVREALDLWYAVHKEGKTLVGPANVASSWTDEDDGFDYSWQ